MRATAVRGLIVGAVLTAASWGLAGKQASAGDGAVGGLRFVPAGAIDFEATPPATPRPVGQVEPSEPSAFNPPDEAGRVEPAVHEADPGQPERVTLVAAEQPPEPSPTNRPAPTPFAVGKQPPFTKQLISLEVKLARQIVKPPADWRFDEVLAGAEKLTPAAASEQNKQALRDLRSRIDRFAAVAERHKLASGGALPATPPIAGPPAGGSGPTASAANQASTVVNNGVGSAAAGPPYDAVGELRPVVSKRPGAPKYALVGRNGKVVTFVTPASGVELDPLLGKQIGARGGRGYMPEYGHRHLTARDVTRLGMVLR